MSATDNPLIEALPPASDYLTYLTIIEYNLTPENLPVLHRVLQDETLTTNIGWDLVHLLVPYLPDSEQCLQDIARLGNPREVILKVTESLRLIEYEQQDEPEGPIDTLAGATDSRARAESCTYPIKTAPTEEGEKRPGSSQMVELPPPLPLPVSQFVALLSMLAILHSRIKTKYPSRFLSTTMQAILGSFSNAESHREELVLAIVKAVKQLMGIERPALPSRKSSGVLSSGPIVTAKSALDPEATTASGDELSPHESAIQRKLLQSFITHVIEEYMLNLPADEDVPGMAWCSRLMEKVQPERIIPGTQTVSERYQREEKLLRRIDAIGQLVTLAQDLKLTDEELLSAAITAEKVAAGTDGEDEPPASAEDIPLSRLGSMLLFTARQTSNILYDTGKLGSSQPFAIFPDHQELLKNCLSSPAQGTGTLGTEPEVLVDAVLALGLVCLEHNAIGEPATDERFNEYLQVTALLSSNCPSPNLRGHAHYLTSTVLRSQPDDNARLTFIRDTLEHCPFENLKVSAVGWIKGETIEANPPTPHHGHGHGAPSEDSETPSIFATPLALDSLAPFLFPSLHADLVTAPLQDAWIAFQTNVSFYLASLNFVYLLLCAKHLHHKLAIADLWQNAGVAGSFLQPLRDANARFREEMDSGGRLTDERSDTVLAEMSLLDVTLERVTKAVSFLNET
ncbi:hypothetical protein LTR85_008741 [Meristemomyces frigidus]|nr:hypothetical protein LTR85_008741 [Meristemomyces frigidus]